MSARRTVWLDENYGYGGDGSALGEVLAWSERGERLASEKAAARAELTEAKAACESARQAYEKARCRLDDAWESARRLGAT